MLNSGNLTSIDCFRGHELKGIYLSKSLTCMKLCTSHLHPRTPTYGDGGGIAGLMCGIITFRMSRQCCVSAGIVISHQAHDRVDLTLATHVVLVLLKPM